MAPCFSLVAPCFTPAILCDGRLFWICRNVQLWPTVGAVPCVLRCLCVLPEATRSSSHHEICGEAGVPDHSISEQDWLLFLALQHWRLGMIYNAYTCCLLLLIEFSVTVLQVKYVWGILWGMPPINVCHSLSLTYMYLQIFAGFAGYIRPIEP